jgi:hypothetical protein
MAPKRSKVSKSAAARPKSATAVVRLPRKLRFTDSAQLSLAILSLQNSAVTSVVESKSPFGGKPIMRSAVSYPPELLAAMRGLFPASREYVFEMHYVTTQTSTAGGGLLGSETINPSVTSFAEWSALSSLFDEVKGSATSISFVSLLADSTAVPPATIVLAFDEQSIASSAPASYLAVARLAESREFHSTLGDSGSGRHFQTRVLTSRAWCNTATPATVSPIGGLSGSWSFGNNGLLPVSTAAFTTTIRVSARLRNRG